MLRAPFAVVADADILDFCFAQGYPFPNRGLHRHRQRLHPLGGSNDATVAVSLFQEMFMLFHQHTVKAIQLLIPLQGSEICRSKNSLHILTITLTITLTFNLSTLNS